MPTWNSALWNGSGAGSGGVTPPTTTGTDLLSALVAYLRTEPTVAPSFTVLGVIKVYSELAPPNTDMPYLVVNDYGENPEGMSLDDEPIRLTVQVVASGEDETRSLATLVKNAIDPPNFNINSLNRSPLSFDGGEEYACERARSRPHKRRGVGRSGQYVYVEDIDYLFRVTPAL